MAFGLVLACYAPAAKQAPFDQQVYGPGGMVGIQVMHADPYLIVALLQGISPPYPEISTTWFLFGAQLGAQGQLGQGGGWLIPEGTLVVNPADNTIWYKPG